MLGCFRFLLASMVVISHLSGSPEVEYIGYYAVRGFFVLSGLVITSALNEVYQARPAQFWLNRVFRIAPLYYFVGLLTGLAVYCAPDEAAQFSPFWSHPSPEDLVLNAFVLPLQFNTVHFRLIMPAWSVAVELVMYMLLWAGIARRESLAWLALTAGIAYHAACVTCGFDWTSRYFPAMSACLSFSVGALLYFTMKDGRLVLPQGWGFTLFSAWALNVVLAGFLGSPYTFGLSYYLNIALSALIICQLFSAVSRGQEGRIGVVDRYLGDAAYPLFLSHWLVAFLLALATAHSDRSWSTLLLAAPILTLSGIVLGWGNRKLVEPLRDQIRVSKPSCAFEEGMGATQSR